MLPIKGGAKIIAKLPTQFLQMSPAGCGLIGGIERAALVWDKKIVGEMGAPLSSVASVQSLKKTKCWKIHEILYVNFTKHFIADQ